MKGSRIISLLILLFAGIILSLPLFVQKISFEDHIDVYAPLSKAYGNVQRNFDDMAGFDINEYIDSERKVVYENSLDSLETYMLHKGMEIESSFHFIGKTKKTRIKISEKIRFTSWINHAMGVLFSDSIKQKRKDYLVRLKQQIESTPDSTIIPSELK